MKKLLEKIFIVAIIFLISGCGKNEDELVIVTEAGFAPYEYYENGEVVGVDIKIANAIADSMGKKLVIKDVAFDSIINEINSGKADFGAAGLSITEERKKSVDFTIEYAVSNQVVVVKKNSNIDINNLNGKTISVQLGTVADDYASDTYPDSKIIRQKKYLSASEDVKNGKSDCLIMDSLPANELIKENSELEILDGILFTDKYGMIVKKGNAELLKKINSVLEDLKSKNKINEYIIEYSK